MNSKSLIIAAVASAVLSSAAVWQIQSGRSKVALADQSDRHALELVSLQGTLDRINEETTRQLAANQAQQREQTAAFANLDAQHY